MIDLGVSAVPDAPQEHGGPESTTRCTEGEGLDRLRNTFGVTEKDVVWSGSQGAAIEEVTAITRMAEGCVKRVLEVGGVA